MVPRFGFPQLEFGAAAHDVAAELDEAFDELQRLGWAETFPF